ncbi:hypothetical protein ACFFX0_10595 [Citricoccus parietis]|uniref:Uncharacterized protein n=1 Tax=Citricoccus parietis TaxID=592307 RepID=A0ABV5FY65_9MICC
MISTTPDSNLVPNRRITAGMSATDGIGRRNSTIERVYLSTRGNVPRRKPSPTPTTVATTSPIAHVRMVLTTYVQKRPVVICSPSSDRTALNGGKLPLPLSRGTSSQARMRSSTPGSDHILLPQPAPFRADRAGAWAVVVGGAAEVAASL